MWLSKEFTMMKREKKVSQRCSNTLEKKKQETQPNCKRLKYKSKKMLEKVMAILETLLIAFSTTCRSLWNG